MLITEKDLEPNQFELGEVRDIAGVPTWAFAETKGAGTLVRIFDEYDRTVHVGASDMDALRLRVAEMWELRRADLS
jgi:hypothetical protein